MTSRLLPGFGDPTYEIDATSGDETFTLPAGFASGRKITVQRVDVSGNTVTVAVPAGNTLDGVTDGSISVSSGGTLVVSAADPGAWRTAGGGTAGGKASWAANGTAKASTTFALPDGTDGVRIPGAPARIRPQWDGTESSYWRRNERLIPAIEDVAFTVFGHSWGNGGVDIDSGNRLVDRLASRHRATSLTNYAVAGTRMDQILGAVQASWVPNSRGLVILVDGVINDSVTYGDETGIPTTREAFRSALALLSAASKVGPGDDSFVYGPGWSSGATSTVNSYVDFGFNGDTAYLQLGFVAASGGTFTVTNSAGTLIATVTTGGYKQDFTGSVPLSGFGAGAHTVRVKLTAGTGSIAGAAFPGATPPPILWVKAGPRGTGEASVNRVTTYQAALAPTAASFANVLSVDVDTLWDQTTMVGPGFHPNDLGMSYLANNAERALAGLTHQQGLNRMYLTTASTPYVAAAPSYVGPGATGPGQVTGLTASTSSQVTLTWTRPSDGGATLTGHEIQSSPAGAATWTTVATVSGSTSIYYVNTGLTAASSYDFRVRAVNAIGNGAYAATATATAGPAGQYVVDSFNRANSASPGTADFGGTWSAVNGGAFAITSNTLVAGPGTANHQDLTIDDGRPDGTIQTKIVTSGGSVVGGIVFRANGTNNANAYVFYRNGSGSYTLRRRDNGGSYTLLGTATGVTGTFNDVIQVVLSGSSIVCKINGTTYISVTDATYAGTRHGLYVGYASGQSYTATFDDYSHVA